MTQINNNVYYNNNSELDHDKENFQNIIEGGTEIEGDIEIVDTTDDVNEELITNDFWYIIDHHKGATGTTIEIDRAAYVQKCLIRELYYTPYKIYGNPYGSMTRIAYSTDIWSLCENKPSFQDNPMQDPN